MGHIDFPPLEPQETDEWNNSFSNSEIQIQNTLKELWNTLKDRNNETEEINDIEPLPIRND